MTQHLIILLATLALAVALPVPGYHVSVHSSPIYQYEYPVHTVHKIHSAPIIHTPVHSAPLIHTPVIHSRIIHPIHSAPLIHTPVHSRIIHPVHSVPIVHAPLHYAPYYKYKSHYHVY